MSETETEAVEVTTSAGRGRPRPEATIERDAKVLTFLQAADGPKTRKDIVAGTELPGNEVYLSLYRLSRAGTIVRTGGTWAVVGPASIDTAPAAE